MWANRIRVAGLKIDRVVRLQTEADKNPEAFCASADLIGAIWKQRNGIFGVSLSELMVDIISEDFDCEELYEQLREPRNVASTFINKMFGPGRYVKIQVGLVEFVVSLRLESPAYRLCKKREQRMRMASSLSETVHTFWGMNVESRVPVVSDLEERKYKSAAMDDASPTGVCNIAHAIAED